MSRTLVALLVVLFALPSTAAELRTRLHRPSSGLQVRIRLPPGVGMRLAPRQRLLLNSHYLNGSAEPLRVDVAINFRAARKRSIRHHALSFQIAWCASA